MNKLVAVYITLNPSDREVTEILSDSYLVDYQKSKVGNSRYACFNPDGTGVHNVVLRLK
jgi:hypothetical protein